MLVLGGVLILTLILRRNRGFTLIEVLVVVAMLTILASITAPMILGRINSARVSYDIAVAAVLSTAVEQWKVDNELSSDLGGQSLPLTWDDLEVYVSSSTWGYLIEVKAFDFVDFSAVQPDSPSGFEVGRFSGRSHGEIVCILVVTFETRIIVFDYITADD